MAGVSVVPNPQAGGKALAADSCHTGVTWHVLDGHVAGLGLGL